MLSVDFGILKIKRFLLPDFEERNSVFIAAGGNIKLLILNFALIWGMHSTEGPP